MTKPSRGTDRFDARVTDDPAAASPDGTFHREGEYWTIVYRGDVCRLRDTRGLRLLACLLRQPGTPAPALSLATAAGRAGARRRAIHQPSDANAEEYARVNVTRAIKSALAKIAEHLPELGDHMRATIRTGGRCVYRPDPRVPMRWKL